MSPRGRPTMHGLKQLLCIVVFLCVYLIPTVTATLPQCIGAIGYMTEQDKEALALSMFSLLESMMFFNLHVFLYSLIFSG
jgi:hypothetical protein